ncbi:hypothetical protein [Nocardia sp. CY41]|uniref:hypothetical protein n=1 Tax=Nocardia sp. CY41 TaxID=2608686 RepID=UPI00135C847E|nr:hypothetical protein [Nocardia sp. CY41]
MSEDSAGMWSRLAGAARSGELYLDNQEVAFACAKACDQRLKELQDLAVLTQDAQNVAGFGDFKMADDLVRKFSKQATGDDNSVDKVVLEHIETVKNMREVMAISFKRITGQDIENATQFANTTEQVR